MTRRRTYCLAVSLLLLPLACRSDHTHPGDVLKAFVDEFYSGRAQSDMTSVVNKYTEWPDFAVGDAKQIATAQDIRLITENADEAKFEVRFKVIGEESLAKVEIGETEVVQTYRLRRRRGQWRILEPIQIPCISVAGELTRLRAAIENASTPETLISNAHASIALLVEFQDGGKTPSPSTTERN